MKKEYSNALRKRFTQLVKNDLSNFEVFTEKSPYITPGAAVFVNRVRSDLWLFVEVFGIKSEEGGFVVQVGWSRLARFPQLGMSPNFFITDRKDEIAKPEGFTRLHNPHLKNDELFYVQGTNKNSLSSLHASSFKSDTQKISSKEALELVSESCDLAFSVLKESGQQFFSEVETA
ncbi:hypothetical protein ISG33_08660 [Glaciecola sp. MH2013]|uniref:hypothetical protein n=1 Tax=Glaciecola sp. MH2013 TaxID=2785524 RepID=UPI00189FF5B7|nr:hypothetical protein [Glaciecola sp. MH2013]MBF7073464.1 hypothetical protein [Glaciecola sp. MH2013]